MSRGNDTHHDTAPRGLPRRLAWFVALWISGVAAVAIVGLVIKLMLGH